jgi:hypothetical protein
LYTHPILGNNTTTLRNFTDNFTKNPRLWAPHVHDNFIPNNNHVFQTSHLIGIMGSQEIINILINKGFELLERGHISGCHALCEALDVFIEENNLPGEAMLKLKKDTYNLKRKLNKYIINNLRDKQTNVNQMNKV